MLEIQINIAYIRRAVLSLSAVSTSDNSWSELLSLVQGTLVNLSEVVASAVEGEAVQRGSVDVLAQDVMRLLKQVQDGTYFPPTADALTAQGEGECEARRPLGECVTDEQNASSGENSGASSAAEDSREDAESDCGSDESAESVDRQCEWPRHV